MNNWEKEKKEIEKLALAIRGSTKEEFPADLANLEDYIYKTYSPTSLPYKPMKIEEDYFCYEANFDCDEPFITLCHKDDVAISYEVEIPYQLAYYLRTHHCGSKKMRNLIQEHAVQNIQHKLKELMGIKEKEE